MYLIKNRHSENSMNAMKLIMCGITFAMTMTVTSAAFAEAPILNPYGQFLEGDGVEVEMAYFAAKNKDGLYDALIKVRGRKAFNAGIDGKTYQYTAVHSGSGVSYQRNGKNILNMSDLKNYSSNSTQVYLDGESISVSENKNNSKDVMPLHLLTASNEQSKN